MGGDRPSFDPPQCVNVGGDRPAWRPPSNLTVTAVSELKIGKFSSAAQTRATARAPSLMSLEPPCASSRPIVHSVGVCDIMQVGDGWNLEKRDPQPPRSVLHRSQARAERLTHSRSPDAENPTPGGQFHKAVIRLFDRYTQCAKCGCDRPTSDPPVCVKQAGDGSTTVQNLLTPGRPFTVRD